MYFLLLPKFNLDDGEGILFRNFRTQPDEEANQKTINYNNIFNNNHFCKQNQATSSKFRKVNCKIITYYNRLFSPPVSRA